MHSSRLCSRTGFQRVSEVDELNLTTAAESLEFGFLRLVTGGREESGRADDNLLPYLEKSTPGRVFWVLAPSCLERAS